MDNSDNNELSFVAVVQIGNILDSYAATLTKRGDHDVFYITTQGISQLVQRSVQLQDLCFM